MAEIGSRDSESPVIRERGRRVASMMGDRPLAHFAGAMGILGLPTDAIIVAVDHMTNAGSTGA